MATRGPADRKWRMTRATAVVVVLLAVVGGCFADEEFSDTMQQRSKVRSRRQTTGYGIAANSVFNKTLRIVTIHHEPYTIVTPTPNVPNSYTFSGFIPDLVQLLAKRLHFKYEFYNVSLFGRLDDVSGNWTGMIGEVIKNEKSNGQEGADIAAGSITITSGRERVVDFLKPFQHIGIVTVVRRPDAAAAGGDGQVDSPYTFGIFQPLDLTVWGLVFLSAFVVVLFLWAMNLYNPYEWGGRHAIGLADSHQADLFNLQGSFWFVATTFQWQGFERSPRSIASKVLSAVWFMFVTLLLVTYTAGIVNNLYWASMTHRIKPPSTVRPRFVDLAHAVSSGEYKFGTTDRSQTYRYIMDVAVGEEFDAIRRYWRTSDGRSQLVSSIDVGLERVRRGGSSTDKDGRPYAFLMESLSAKYYVNRRPCDLVALGEPIGSRSHGFAIPTTMPYVWSDELHRGLLELLEEGDVEDLERRYFIATDECWNVTLIERAISDASASLYADKPRSIDLSTFAGPFVLILVGLLVSVGIAFAEMMYYRQCGRYQSSNRPQSQQLRLDPDEGNI